MQGVDWIDISGGQGYSFGFEFEVEVFRRKKEFAALRVPKLICSCLTQSHEYCAANHEEILASCQPRHYIHMGRRVSCRWPSTR